MNGTEEHNFRLTLAEMTASEIAEAINTGQYQEPFLAIAKGELTARSSRGAETRDKSRVFLQALQFFVAFLALIVAILAYFKP